MALKECFLTEMSKIGAVLKNGSENSQFDGSLGRFRAGFLNISVSLKDEILGQKDAVNGCGIFSKKVINRPKRNVVSRNLSPSHPSRKWI